MDRATIALVLSIIAVLLAISKWLFDFLRGQPRSAFVQRRQWRSRSRVDLIAGQTNCFITRGGYLLFLISCRVYNDSDQIPITIEGYQFQAKIRRRWQTAEQYTAPQAAIFPSLLRNSLPVILEPEQRQDFYEVFMLDELIPSPQVKVRLALKDEKHRTIKCQATLKHRVDERAVFDMLFRVLE